MTPDSSRETPRVSVLMSVLDPDHTYLREALRSVLDQSLQELEIVLLEDPSRTSAAALVAELGDPRLRYVLNDERVPLAISRRQTLDLARADVVAIMDCDDICEPTRLERQCAFLDEHEDVDVVGTQIAVIKSDGTPRGYRSYPLDHDAIVAAMRRFNPLAHPTVVMRKVAVEEAGGYRSCAGGTVDDYELWSRMATSGRRFANLPDALLRYRLHDASMKSRLVRQTLADTIWVKRQYWRNDLGLRGHLRIAGEAILSQLPPRVVSALFRQLTIRPRLRAAQGTPA